jgi:hypothetical protein
MITKEQFISSIIYSFIGDAFATPLDGLNPQYILNNHPNGFFNYIDPQPISKNHNLVAGSISDIGATAYMVMEMLYDNEEINEYQFSKFFNRLQRNSSFKKHDYEKNYDNLESQEFSGRPGFTNVTRALALTLTHLDSPYLEEKLVLLNDITHQNDDDRCYMLFHNMMLKDLTDTKNLALSVFNCLDYLPNKKDREIMCRILEEYKLTGAVDLEHILDISKPDSIDDIMYSNYPFAIASVMNEKYSLLEKFLNAIYMGGSTSFNCFAIGSIHGILFSDIERIDDTFLEKLHYGNEIRIIDIYNLAEALYNKYNKEIE